MDNRSALKELHIKNNKSIEVCEKQSKSIHILDMETTILENSVMSPSDLDLDISSENIDNNQENFNPIYSVLNSFDPYLKRDCDEVKLAESFTDNIENLLDVNEIVKNTERDILDRDNIFVISIIEDLIKKVVGISTINNSINFQPAESSTCCELHNISSESENSVLDNTIIANKLLGNDNLQEQRFNDKVSLSNVKTVKLNESSESTLCNSSFIDTFAKKLILSSVTEESIQNINNQDLKKNYEIEINVNNDFNPECKLDGIKLEKVFNEVSHEIDTEQQKIIEDSKEISKIITEKNYINAEADKVINDISNKGDKKDCVVNENVSIDINNITTQTNDVLNEINNTQTFDYIYENFDAINNLEDNIISDNNIILEDIHMSAAESNIGVNEPSVANRLALGTSATCTNDMSEIINQNEYFEKQLDKVNGTMDNKEMLEAKVRVYREMAEKYAIVETECEKYKVQIVDLKKELKSCRQKTIALEAEVADLKRRENELNLILEEYKQSTAIANDSKEQNEQLQRFQVSEESLKNEVKELKTLVKQHETHLKELQRKEVKLADDLSCKTQSELQISRVMEEYEKSISSLITENEKMKKERDTAQMHLANIELAFSDVHQKYERCKAIVQGYKDNEESFKQDIAMNRETIVIQEQKYDTLKAHAMAQLEKSNQELATMKKQHEIEMARLTAQLKRYEIKTVSLMESLEQKNKECEQLSAVCDEFIGNV